MDSKDYEKLRVLIVDDFPNFRTTLAKNMHTIGFRNITSLASGSEALNSCQNGHYDIILSDYNLGDDKNGQQLLEEIRHLHLVRRSDIFILISADTSRDVVMATYDCEPSDYLTKPITGKTLEQRIKRLLARRGELYSVYKAIDEEDYESAIALLKSLLEVKSRYSVECQKMLGEIYLKQQSYERAEELYKGVLEKRELDWAKVGLANVNIAYGQYAIAANALSMVIEEHPAYLKAYDSLSNAYRSMDDSDRLQEVLEKATKASPMSISRQKTLADVALINGDVALAVKAYKKTIKYGANSHYDNADNHLNLARAITKVYDEGQGTDQNTTMDALHLLNNIDNNYSISEEQKIQATLLNSQINSFNGNKQASKELFDEAQELMINIEERNIDTEVENINALMACGRNTEVSEAVKEMLVFYKDDQVALEKIDFLLEEPVSEKGKKVIGTINKKGIEYYKEKNFEKSIEYFFQAQRKYPRYIGLKLNFVQALISSLKEGGVNQDYMDKTESTFKIIERHVTVENTKYERYKQLKLMFNKVVQHMQHQQDINASQEKKNA
ncbi:MAG: DNA-binding response OmpR family regulator [Granulosicoccus sp.]|jgi:DNA-binding response OmpR family regulator